MENRKNILATISCVFLLILIVIGCVLYFGLGGLIIPAMVAGLITFAYIEDRDY